MSKIVDELKREYKETKKSSILVYFILRFLVILCLIRQVILGNFDSALLCVLSLFLLILPIIIQRKFKITLPNINFKAFNHQDKVNGEVNGGVNGEVNNRLDNWISDIVIKLTEPRDADIIQAIGNNPGIKMKELVNILTLKYPKINSNIISKRIKIHNHLIEFKGAPKTVGYYLKKQDQLDKQ